MKEKLWAIEVKREIEETYFGHIKAIEEPTQKELEMWFEEQGCEDNPEYCKFIVWEVEE